MRIKNHMYHQVQKINRLPQSLVPSLTTFVMGRFVPFINTSGLQFETLTREEVRVSIRNKRKVQNHIRGVHACVMALLAETASGFVFGMNTPDDKLMLLKSMHIDYTKRSVGNMYAIATLDENNAQQIQQEERGNMLVPVHVYDESGEEPIEVQMVWAWVLKKSKE